MCTHCLTNSNQFRIYSVYYYKKICPGCIFTVKFPALPETPTQYRHFQHRNGIFVLDVRPPDTSPSEKASSAVTQPTEKDRSTPPPT